MSSELWAQRFLFGERVKCNDFAFVVTAISFRDGKFSYSGVSTGWYAEERLVLAPERPPYAPSERRIVSCLVTVYRLETDTELAARHAIERAEYDAQGDGS